MKRALQLARKGHGRVSPNPMVGAVITHGDKIIGEGFHEVFGGPHAEVNAINSVKEEDRHLLSESTIYVTLEPCAHFGKTPPCANLIVKTGIPEVVVGSPDPNPLVAGKGIKILKDAGIKVTEGVLHQECDNLNRHFITAHKLGRPYIILKWAQSADGYMARVDETGNPEAVKFSNPLSSIWMHRERAGVDAILIGANTQRIDHPRLNVRLWGGNSPKKFVAENNLNIPEFLENLRKEGITSLMVEGGPTLLKSFINQGFYDEIRVETAPFSLHQGLKAPLIPQHLTLVDTESCRDNIIQVLRS